MILVFIQFSDGQDQKSILWNLKFLSDTALLFLPGRQKLLPVDPNSRHFVYPAASFEMKLPGASVVFLIDDHKCICKKGQKFFYGIEDRII